jgi:hypothetical protein
MRQIEQLYTNEFGMAFYWREDQQVFSQKVQIVFKETGFYFTPAELQKFAELIEDSCRKNSCAGCNMRSGCIKFLLKTPVSQIDLAVSMEELNGIKDLVHGVLFRLQLERFINAEGRN